MKKKNILRIVLAVLLAAILGGCLYLNSLMPIITGYAAKNLASDVFVSGREPADVGKRYATSIIGRILSVFRNLRYREDTAT